MVEGGSSKDDCTPCKMGEYSDEEGATACKACQSGFSSLVRSTRHSDCEPRVIILPKKIPVKLTPDDEPVRQSLTVVNTGVKPFSWFAKWANGARPEWVRLLKTAGEVVAGNLTKIDLELSFPRNLANTHTLTQELMILAGNNTSVMVELTTKPGKFNPNASFLQDNSAGSVFVGETARYTVVTRDQYSQSRLESAAEGSLQLQVVPLLSSGAQSCTVHCTRDISSCRACCCKDKENGKYSVTFMTDKEGKYRIEVLTLREGLPLRFKNGQDGILVVKEVLDHKTSCGEMSIQQLNGKGASKSQLKIEVNSAKADAKFLLSRVDADQVINGTANSASGKWSAYEFLKPGAWQVEYRSGKEICNTTALAEVTCLAEFEQKGDQCNAIPTHSNQDVCMHVCLYTCMYIRAHACTDRST